MATWTPKTNSDDVMAAHINDLQTGKVDSDGTGSPVFQTLRTVAQPVFMDIPHRDDGLINYGPMRLEWSDIHPYAAPTIYHTPGLYMDTAITSNTGQAFGFSIDGVARWEYGMDYRNEDLVIAGCRTVDGIYPSADMFTVSNLRKFIIGPAVGLPDALDAFFTFLIPANTHSSKGVQFDTYGGATLVKDTIDFLAHGDNERNWLVWNQGDTKQNWRFGRDGNTKRLVAYCGDGVNATAAASPGNLVFSVSTVGKIGVGLPQKTLHAYLENLSFGEGLPHLSTGDRNNSFGHHCQAALTSAADCCAFGKDSQEVLTSQYAATSFGNYTLMAATTGTGGNSAFGFATLEKLTSGAENTAVGMQAGDSITTTVGGVFLGAYAGFYETAANKLFIDNAKRINEADGRIKALLYGIFAAATANQWLRINGHFGILLSEVPAGANNAAAQAAGLAVGDFYRTNADPSVLCIRSA